MVVVVVIGEECDCSDVARESGVRVLRRRRRNWRGRRGLWRRKRWVKVEEVIWGLREWFPDEIRKVWIELRVVVVLRGASSPGFEHICRVCGCGWRWGDGAELARAGGVNVGGGDEGGGERDAASVSSLTETGG